MVFILTGPTRTREQSQLLSFLMALLEMQQLQNVSSHQQTL